LAWHTKLLGRTLIDIDYLRNNTVLRTIDYRTQVDSTNDAAKLRLEHGGLELPALIIVDRQLKGRGRYDRGWWSDSGSMTCSIVLHESAIAVPALLALTTAVAVCDSIIQLDHALRPAIKWPNDVLIQGRKIAGILIESRLNGKGDTACVVGVGVNTNCRMNQAPADLQASSCSIRDLLGREIDQTRFVADAVNHLMQRLMMLRTNADGLIAEAQSRAWLEVGSLVTVQPPTGELRSGRFVGFGTQGELILEADSGHIVIYSGTAQS
jgi:BirA family biotin operon repressor/biotin-[acetyl-CoA-carboxylase] ligase